MKRYTELRCNSRKKLSEIVPLEKPFAITIDPCSVCNFRCEQCLQSDPEKAFPRRMMSFQEFRKIIDDMKAWKGDKLKVVKLYNRGEPLLNGEFAEMLKYLHEADITERIDLTSNGTMLTEEMAGQLIDYGVDYLRVSIYSPIQERNEQITHSRIDVGIIYENLYRLKQKKTEKESSKPFIAIKMFEPEDENEKKYFIDKYTNIADELFFETEHDFAGDGRREMGGAMRSGKEVCPWPFYSLTIQSDGTVDCCCVDWEDKTKVGNALEESIEQIWKGERLNAFCMNQLNRQRRQMDSCKKCGLYLTDLFTVDNIDDLTIDEYQKRKACGNGMDKQRA